MRSGGGKQKGASFERSVAKALSLWVTDGKKEDCFWRSAMSGGRSTVHLKKGKKLDQHAGDITATSPEGHLLTDFCIIECKHYRNLRLDMFFIHGKGTLAGFWRKLCKEGSHFKKQPFMVVRQNRIPTLVVTTRLALQELIGFKPEEYDDTIISVNHAKFRSCVIVKFDTLVSDYYFNRRG